MAQSTTYEKLKNSSLDISDLGLIIGMETSESVFTPLGATVIGWAGVDGIHFCFVEGFWETVFAVNPTAAPGKHIHPVAKNLSDFLGLILACRGTAAVARAWSWTKYDFQHFVDSTPLSRKQQSICSALKNGYSPSQICDPYAYLLDMRQDFDYTSLPLHPDFAEQTDPPPQSRHQKVRFDRRQPAFRRKPLDDLQIQLLS